MMIFKKHDLLLCAAILICSCGSTDRPLDAPTRQRIDSISAAQIKAAKAEIDTQCVQLHQTKLPSIVDSLKKERLRQIQEKLKTVPK